MKKFLVIDYSKNTKEDFSNDEIRIVGLDKLFEEIDAARENKSRKIAVYAIGECLLDWT